MPKKNMLYFRDGVQDLMMAPKFVTGNFMDYFEMFYRVMMEDMFRISHAVCIVFDVQDASGHTLSILAFFGLLVHKLWSFWL